MKKLLFAVCALAAISMLAPSAGFAQWENRIGLYSAPDANDAATRAYIATPTAYLPFNMYLVLTNPMYNGAPVSQINAFECTITVTPENGSFLKTLDSYAVQALDVDSSTWGFAVGFASPLTVTGGQVVLCTMNAMVFNVGPFDLFLHPATVQSVAGFMAIDVPDGVGGSALVGCLPSSGDFEDVNADFAVGGLTIGLENDTFGGVKALFR